MLLFFADNYYYFGTSYSSPVGQAAGGEEIRLVINSSNSCGSCSYRQGDHWKISRQIQLLRITRLRNDGIFDADTRQYSDRQSFWQHRHHFAVLSDEGGGSGDRPDAGTEPERGSLRAGSHRDEGLLWRWEVDEQYDRRRRMAAHRWHRPLRRRRLLLHHGPHEGTHQVQRTAGRWPTGNFRWSRDSSTGRPHTGASLRGTRNRNSACKFPFHRSGQSTASVLRL